MTYALHATTFLKTTTGLPVMVVRLGTTLDVPAWKSVKSPGSVAVSYTHLTLPTIYSV